LADKGKRREHIQQSCLHDDGCYRT
jgi:hypothetical protein